MPLSSGMVKEGAPRLPNQRRNTRPLLSDDVLRCSRDWQFLFDVGTGYSVFPIDIAVTRQRPDIVIFSQSLRVDILIELTVPLEDRIAAASTRKTDRYSALLATCENNGWHATHFPVEVGSRGWVAHSLLTCLQKLGFSASWCKKVRRECIAAWHLDLAICFTCADPSTLGTVSMSFHLNQAQVARTMTRLRSS